MTADVAALLSSARCGAKTRSGTPCRAPAVKGRKRCRMHGCAKGAGAPGGNKNALKHGRFTKEAFAERAEHRQHRLEFRAALAETYAFLKWNRALLDGAKKGR